jgi:outer membrane protein OmpA-like peptidoglycan-associated protein
VSVARIPKDQISVWPAFTDAMLAFVLVLVVALAYQVGQAVDIVGPVVDEGLEIRVSDQQRIRDRIEGLGLPGVQIPITDDVNQHITFGSDVTFEPAQASLRPDGQQLLQRLARTIVGTGEAERVCSLVEIQVSGHTDDIPIHTASFPSNWELSTARAVSVVKALVDAGVDPDLVTMSATGYGEHQPVGRDRAASRRIEMRLTYTNSKRHDECH